MDLFDDIDKRFRGRVREFRWISGETGRGSEVLGYSEGKAYIDADFDLEIFDRLHDPALIGVRRRYRGADWYIVLEVTSIYPYHLEMGSLDPSVPPLLKEEALVRIHESWESGGENWMSIEAIHTGYMLRDSGDDIEVVRKGISPLIGEEAHILNKDVYSALINKGDVDIGVMLGYDVNVKISTYPLYRYHTGFFGYTGTGKSNLVSTLLRKTLEENEDLVAVVIDSTGEYPVNILDMIYNYGIIYVDPETVIDRFIETVVMPETLNKKLGGKGEEIIRDRLRDIWEDGRIQKIFLSQLVPTLEDVVNIFSSKDANEKINPLMKFEIQTLIAQMEEYLDEPISKLYRENPEVIEAVKRLIETVKDSISERTNLYKNLEHMEIIIDKAMDMEDREVETPKTLAWKILYDDGFPRVCLLYSPEPDFTAKLIALLIERIFRYKKTEGLGREVLFVVDEAHEYIPREARGGVSDSNKALEMLFRQGRKYKAGGWIATQRVAHLNTNILQQLHSYFISNLPRTYDRNVIADSFSVSRSIIDQVTRFERGQWIMISHVATKYPGIPVVISTPNNEDNLVEFLRST